MKRKNYRNGAKVFVHFVNHVGKPYELGKVLKRRYVMSVGPESAKRKEFLVQSMESDKKEWVSGFFVRNVRRTELKNMRGKITN